MTKKYFLKKSMTKKLKNKLGVALFWHAFGKAFPKQV